MDQAAYLLNYTSRFHCKALQKLLNCFQLIVLIAFGSAIIGGQFNYYYFSLLHQLVTDCFLYISRNLSLNHFWNLLAECMYIDIILSFYHLFVPIKYELCIYVFSFLSSMNWACHFNPVKWELFLVIFILHSSVWKWPLPF